MELIIVSGLSGSGKSIALHRLEDLGYFSVDNLPIFLLENFITGLSNSNVDLYQTCAVGIDARSLPDELLAFPSIVQKLKDTGIKIRIIFLHTDTDVLIKRFSETRRKHPITSEHVSLAEAVALEKELLEPISRQADDYIDTTRTNIHQLRGLISDRVNPSKGTELTLAFQSFGFKHGVPGDANFVFDTRCLPNPYWEPALRELTGMDKPVQEFLRSQPLVDEMFNSICQFVEQWMPRFIEENRTYLTVAIGCTGGQHRSVYLTERLARHFKASQRIVTTLHTELGTL